MLTDITDDVNRPPLERMQPLKNGGYARNTSNKTRLHVVDESKQTNWLDRARQSVHCIASCKGRKCRHEDYESLDEETKRSMAIEGLISNWVGPSVIASQRPSTSLFVKYPIISLFKHHHVTGVFNLQEKGEHGHCGPDGVYESTGYSYNAAEDLMPHGVACYEFPWPDMTTPQQDVVLRSVQVMSYHVKRNDAPNKMLVHCHAGLGRTGLMIACYFIYNDHMTSKDAIQKVRDNRPGAIQTEKQFQFVRDFETHLHNLCMAFRVNMSDPLVGVRLFVERQRKVLHGWNGDLHRWVPRFLHAILCRLVLLTHNNVTLSREALQSLGPSCAPKHIVQYRSQINRRRFIVQVVSDPKVLSFLVADWFRGLTSPALSVADGDELVAYMRSPERRAPGSVIKTIRRVITSKAVRHTMGIVISAFYIITNAAGGGGYAKYAFHVLEDAFSHAFNPVKLRHSPIERELIHQFFLLWAESIADMYFNVHRVSALEHRTVKSIAVASSLMTEQFERHLEGSTSSPRYQPSRSPSPSCDPFPFIRSGNLSGRPLPPLLPSSALLARRLQTTTQDDDLLDSLEDLLRGQANEEDTDDADREEEEHSRHTFLHEVESPSVPHSVPRGAVPAWAEHNHSTTSRSRVVTLIDDDFSSVDGDRH